MEMVLHGYRHNKGDYEGRVYDNHKLYVSHTKQKEETHGQEVSVLTVTNSVFDDFIKGKKDTDVLNKIIAINFGMNGVIQFISVVK